MILVGTAAAVLIPAGLAGIANAGPHGFSEILYAFSSAANNNGSAFAGLSANTLFYNTTLGMAMLIGRFWLMIAVLAAAGSLARKKFVPAGAGTLPTHTPLFILFLVAVIVLVGALTFIPRPCPRARRRTSDVDSIKGKYHAHKNTILFSS